MMHHVNEIDARRVQSGSEAAWIQGHGSRTAGRWSTRVLLTFLVLLIMVCASSLLVGCQLGGSGAPSKGAGTGIAQPGASPHIPALSGNNTQEVREAVIAAVRPAVVQVNVKTDNGGALGSGVIIDRRGYIITNNHVVNGALNITIAFYDGKSASAQVTGTDPTDDLAVLKVNPAPQLTVAKLGDSSKLVVGQTVLAIGNPLGITQTVTSGIISALERNVSEGQNGPTIPDAIQTDAPINPGNSGGALVDLQGNVIGIPTLTAIDPEFKAPANGVGFAIPSNRVQFIAPQIIQTGKVTHTGRAALGVKVTTVDAQLAAQDNLTVNHGALIVDVVSNGPAAQAGLKAGDVIVQLDGQQVQNVSSLSDALLSKSPGETVSVQVYRGNQQLTAKVKLGELSAG